jgi:hypothetical protein
VLLESVLRSVHVVLLFPQTAPKSQTSNSFLADHVGMTQSASVPFLCVDAAALSSARRNDDHQPEMKPSSAHDADTRHVTVQASAGTLQRQLEAYNAGLPAVMAGHARRHVASRCPVTVVACVSTAHDDTRRKLEAFRALVPQLLQHAKRQRQLGGPPQ